MDEVNRTAELLDNAIKKQIPQEPILVNSHKNHLSLRYECPACHGNFTGTGIASYCYHCGQALDWDKIGGRLANFVCFNIGQLSETTDEVEALADEYERRDRDEQPQTSIDQQWTEVGDDGDLPF